MRELALTARRGRSLLPILFVAVASVAAGWGIYSGERKVLGLLALFTIVVFLRRWNFEDFFFLTIMAAVLGHVRIGFIADEFERDKWLALFMMGGVSLVAAARRIRTPPWPRLAHLPVLGLVILGVASVSWSWHPWYTFQTIGVWAVGMFVAYVGAWCYCLDLARVRRVVLAHVATLWLVFPLGFLILLVPFPGKWFNGRFRSMFYNPNNIGEWASLCLPIVFGLFLMEKDRLWRWTTAIMLGSGVLVAYASGSRGGVGGAAIGIAFYCFMRFRKRVILFGTAAGLVATFLILYDVDLVGMLRGEDVLIRADTLDTLSTRRFSWELALVIGAQRPWLGHGFGLGDRLYLDYGLDLVQYLNTPSVHSSYLDAYMNVGMLGLGLMVGIQGLACLAGWLAWRRDREGEVGLLALTLTAAVLGFSAHAVVETTLLSVGNPWSLPFWTYTALLCRLKLLATARSRAVPPDLVAPHPGETPAR